MKRYMIIFLGTCFAFMQCSIALPATEKYQVTNNGEAKKNLGYGELAPIDIQYMERILGSLPSQSVIAAHLIVDGKWFILDASEMSTLSKFLEKAKPFVVPEGIDHVSLRARTESIVFWGIHEGKLVAIDIIHIESSVSIFNSVAQNQIYEVKELENEKKVLRQMLAKAKASIDKPVATEVPQSLLKPEDTNRSKAKGGQGKTVRDLLRIAPVQEEEEE